MDTTTTFNHRLRAAEVVGCDAARLDLAIALALAGTPATFYRMDHRGFFLGQFPEAFTNEWHEVNEEGKIGDMSVAEFVMQWLESLSSEDRGSIAHERSERAAMLNGWRLKSPPDQLHVSPSSYIHIVPAFYT